MANMTYGYIRVSSREQNEERQLTALKEAGVSSEGIYIDKKSGKDFDRPAYSRMVERLRRGDLLFIKSIDRLGRNYEEILHQWRVITKEIRADVVVLDMPLLDTRTKNRGLTETFIADLVLQLLSYMAENERESINQRQKEGIAAAKARGVRFGRIAREMPEGFEEICAQYAAGLLSVRAAAERLSMSPTTFYRKYREIGEKTK